MMKKVIVKNITLTFNTFDEGADQHTELDIMDEINNIIRFQFGEAIPIFLCAVDDLEIKVGDTFTYEHPKYPNSSIIGKHMIAESIDETHIEQKDTKGELIIRRYPIEYCTKVN